MIKKNYKLRRRKTYSKRFWGVFLIGVMILLNSILCVSAMDWDNVRSYNENTKTITITNALGLGNKIADVQLKSPLINYVMPGENRLVAEFEINSESDYSNVFKKMEFFDKNNGMKSFDRDFSYKYKKVIDIEKIPIYKTVCENKLLANGTNLVCEQQIDSYENKEIYEWVELNTKQILLKGNITIGIFTDVYSKDNVEWIPTLFGERINEWAIWTSSFNTGLVSYFKFDETSGTNTKDEVNNHDGTLSNMEDADWMLNATCKIGGCINFSETNEYINLSDESAFDMDEFTINFWMKKYENLKDYRIISKDEGHTSNFWLVESGGGLIFSTGNTAGDNYGIRIISSSTNSAGRWMMVTARYNSTRASFFLNGTLIGNNDTPDYYSNDFHVNFAWAVGNTNAYLGMLDELGIWNRSLTDSEITDLYNSGTGLTYSPKPTVSITYPISETYNHNVEFLNYTVTGANLDKCLYSKDGGLTNSSLVTAGTNWTGLSSSEGSNTWNVYCNNTEGWSNDSIIFIQDTISPTISISHGNGTINYGALTTNHSINFTATDTNLDACWYDYNITNVTIDCATGVINTTSFVLEYGNYYVNIWTNDTGGNLNNQSSTWDYKLFEINESYVGSTTSGATNNFNITFETNGIPITLAYFHYNNTKFVGSISSEGNNYTLSKNQIIPRVTSTTNISFYWNITRSDDFNYLKSSKNQIISPININETCGVGTYPIYNLTLVDEKTQVKINESLYNSTIKIDLNLYDSDRTSLLSTFYKEFSETNPAVICIDNDLSSGEMYSLDAQIEYYATNYSTEKYNIERYSLNSNSLYQNITLYDLDTTNAQKFKLLVRDSSYIPIGGALIQIERKYIENGTYYITEIPKTGGSGISSASLEIDDVIYSFYIYLNGELQSSFIDVVAICQNPTLRECEIEFNSYQEGLKIPDYQGGDDFNFTIDFNKTSNVIISQFLIPSGDPATVRLEVIREDTLGTAVCEDTLTSASGTLSCIVPNSFGNSTVRANLYKNDIKEGWGTIKRDQNPSDIYGVILIIISVFVLMTLLGLGISDNPIVTGMFLFIGVVLIFALNLVENTGFYGATASILFLAIAIIIVMIKAGRRS